MISSLRRPLGLLFLAAASFVAAIALTNPFTVDAAQPKTKPSPESSPTPVPTPYMALELIPNGTWMIIEQASDITYSTMKLTAKGTAINGMWLLDNKKSYFVAGTRDGSHLKLDLRLDGKPDSNVVGKVDATLDGIADMYGTITLNGVDTPFQGAQHSRVPAPVDTGPVAGPTPFH